MEMERKSEIGAITEPIMEYVCDCLCRFPREAEGQDDLVPICAKCKLGQHVNDLHIKFNSYVKSD